MFCGNSFTSTNLQNQKKNHMKKLQKRYHRVNRALFLSGTTNEPPLGGHIVEKKTPTKKKMSTPWPKASKNP